MQNLTFIVNDCFFFGYEVFRAVIKKYNRIINDQGKLV